jgi:8-oxo-dGTP pyrophosphatase MutT (NUDIX family)
VVKPWRRIRSHQNESFRIFSIRTDTAVSPRTGESHDFYILESKDWINIIPVTPENEVVMVKQYRHGSGEVTLEIPGGIVDPGDTPQSAAVRELLEETGYETADLSQIGSVNPNPAIFNNRCHTFLARNVKKISNPMPDQTEDIEVVLVPLAEIPASIREGKIDHAIVIAAFYHYFLATQKGT